MKSNTRFNLNSGAIVLTLFSIICAVLLTACGTTGSIKTEKFAFAYGIPKPDVPAEVIRTSYLRAYIERGEIIVVFVVEADGFVRLAAASGPSPRMREAAVQAVRGFAFEPALLDGKPVRSVQCVAWVFTQNASLHPITTQRMVWKDAREFLETRR